jgi:RNA polymerase primary sigma factor
MTAAIEAPRRPIPHTSALRKSDKPHSGGCCQRTIEFIAGLPYSSWEEADVTTGSEQWRALTHDEERHLFRQMNLAYFQAFCLRQKMTDDGDEISADEVERLIARADSIREELARSFYKLNFSIVSRYANRMHTFDELVCEGHFTLLRALARFNPERGYRFSTYAMHAIRRRIFRFMQQRHRQRQGTEAWSDSSAPAEERKGSLAYQQTLTAATAALERLLPELSPRERFVIRARFGWGREFEPRTLQQIADELGVSRERIRQLEERALRKLRTLAATLDIELE